jgi:hypothetical protein
VGEAQAEDRTWFDAVADRFEWAWVGGERPRIEDELHARPTRLPTVYYSSKFGRL